MFNFESETDLLEKLQFMSYIIWLLYFSILIIIMLFYIYLMATYDIERERRRFLRRRRWI